MSNPTRPTAPSGERLGRFDEPTMLLRRSISMAIFA
jgi:hypothetical protein